MDFIAELRRRNVGKVALLYLVASWLLLQVASVLFDALELPPWSVRLVLGILLLGLPLSLIFSWVYEITPDGVKREREGDPAGVGRVDTGRKLNLLIAALLLASTGLLVADRFRSAPAPAGIEAAVPEPAQTALAALGETDATKQSIAVLPLHMPIEEASGRAVADGLTQSIEEMLGRLADIRVSSRESIRIAIERERDPRAAGLMLETDFVMHGELAVDPAGSATLALSLLRVADGATVWSSAFQQPRDQLFRVMGPTFDGVQGAMLPAAPIAHDALTQTSESAQELYWLARQRLQQGSPGDAQDAIELLQRALAIDSRFGPAYCALAQAWRSHALQEGADLQSSVEHAQAVVAQALAIDPNLVCAHLTSAWILSLQWRAPLAEASIRRALEIDPDNVTALSLLGNSTAYQGHPREALALHERAQSLDPLNPLPKYLRSQVMVHLGRTDEAIALARDGFAGFPPSFAALARTLLAVGRIAEASTALSRLAGDIRGDLYVPMMQVAADAALGDLASARATMATIPQGISRIPIYGETRARLFWQQGAYNDALAWIESADGVRLAHPWRRVLRAHTRALAGDEAGALADYDAAFAAESDRLTIAYSWYPLHFGLGELANHAALRASQGLDAEPARDEFARILDRMIDGGTDMPAIDYLQAARAALDSDATTADQRLGSALEHGWRDPIALDVDLPWRAFRGTPWLQARREQLAALLAADRAALQPAESPAPAG